MPTYLITGANTGIGRTTAEQLAAKGGTVIIAGRSAEKTKPVVDALRIQYPKAGHDFIQLDLADLCGVDRVAAEYVASGRPLDVLINNAGRAGPGGLSADGFDITFATNHLGPFLLTQRLLPVLTAAPQGRVVNVSSQAQFMVKQASDIPWDALRTVTPRKGSFGMYGVTKLMNVLHAKELARRLASTRVTTYSLHPGVIASDIWREVPLVIRAVMKLFMTSNEKGAATSVYCASAPELARVSGRYYDKSQEKAPNPLADDEGLARELFTRSEAMILGALGHA